MPCLSRLLAILWLAASPAVVMAQGVEEPSAGVLGQDILAPNFDAGMEAPAETLSTPESFLPSLDGAPVPAPSGVRHQLVLEARLVEGAPALTEGLAWRVFSATPHPEGELPLVEVAEGGIAEIRLPPGDYLVHAAFGRAGATKRVTIQNEDQTESVVLDAGGLELDSVVGQDQAISADRLSFEVLQEDETGELVTVVPNAKPRRVLRLSAGKYHVVSRYGNINAVVRADIEVEAGKLTQAVMRHTGAEVTLKLVSEEGGEALANTSWTVTTQDAIEVHESVGAFPSLVLAAGNYTAIAKHQDQIYSRDFTVEAGLARDIEVRLSDLVQPEIGAEVNPAAGGAPMEP